MTVSVDNFGKLGTSHETPDDASKEKPKRVDEEDAMEGGLKGRISAGAEFYLSTKEKSAGGMSRWTVLLSGLHSLSVRWNSIYDFA